MPCADWALKNHIQCLLFPFTFSLWIQTVKKNALMVFVFQRDHHLYIFFCFFWHDIIIATLICFCCLSLSKQVIFLLIVYEGLKEHWSGLWRWKHWSNGFGFTSCSWWWQARYWVWHPFSLLSHCFSISSLLFLFFPPKMWGKRRIRVNKSPLCLVIDTVCHVIVSCRVIPKTLMPREVCLLQPGEKAYSLFLLIINCLFLFVLYVSLQQG